MKRIDEEFWERQAWEYKKAGYPIAYAVAFVVMAAQSRDGVVLTGDPEFEIVKGIVR